MQDVSVRPVQSHFKRKQNPTHLESAPAGLLDFLAIISHALPNVLGGPVERTPRSHQLACELGLLARRWKCPEYLHCKRSVSLAIPHRKKPRAAVQRS